MPTLIAAVLGVLYGVRTAKKRGGNRLDRVHYGAIYGIVFGLLGLFATVIADRLVI